jgi:hypothetical protein
MELGHRGHVGKELEDAQLFSIGYEDRDVVERTNGWFHLVVLARCENQTVQRGGFDSWIGSDGRGRTISLLPNQRAPRFYRG